MIASDRIRVAQRSSGAVEPDDCLVAKAALRSAVGETQKMT